MTPYELFFAVLGGVLGNILVCVPWALYLRRQRRLEHEKLAQEREQRLREIEHSRRTGVWL